MFPTHTNWFPSFPPQATTFTRTRGNREGRGRGGEREREREGERERERERGREKFRTKQKKMKMTERKCVKTSKIKLLFRNLRCRRENEERKKQT